MKISKTERDKVMTRVLVEMERVFHTLKTEFPPDQEEQSLLIGYIEDALWNTLRNINVSESGASSTVAKPIPLGN